jgi:hypothetical protein
MRRHACGDPRGGKRNADERHTGRAPWALRAGGGKVREWAIGTRGFPGIEVNFPEDYEGAIAEILPQINGIPAVGADPVAPPMTAGVASR